MHARACAHTHTHTQKQTHTDTPSHVLVCCHMEEVERLWSRWQTDVICTFLMPPKGCICPFLLKICSCLQKLGRHVSCVGLYIWSWENEH